MIIQENISLKNYNTFKIDVLCRYFVKILSEQILLESLQNKDLHNEKKLPLGVGSNLLFTDNYEGLVLKNEIGGIRIIEEDDNYIFVKAGGGVIWDDMVEFSLMQNAGGIENLVLIPGTVGASPVQNIGAYGQELKDTFYSLEAIMLDTTEKIILNKNECDFGYRSSIFKKTLKNKAFITSVTYRLVKNPVPNYSYGDIKRELEKLQKSNYSITEVSNAIKSIRQKKLPDPAIIGSAGSFFKNPEIEKERYAELKLKFSEMPGYAVDSGKIKVPAGWLIEQTGWKGKEAGNAATYKEQSLVIINKGNANGKEILLFAAGIKKDVFDKYGIMLEEEVNVI